MANDAPPAKNTTSLSCPKNDAAGEKERRVKECLQSENSNSDNNDGSRNENRNKNVIDLVTLRRLASTRDGLVSTELRRMAWPKLVAAHLEIWRTASRPAPEAWKLAVSRGADNDTHIYDDDDDNDTHNDEDDDDDDNRPLHHPSKEEIARIKRVVASCQWESDGIWKEDSPAAGGRRRRGGGTDGEHPPTARSDDDDDERRRVRFRLSVVVREEEEEEEPAFTTRRREDRKKLRKVLSHLVRTHPDFPITDAACCAVAMVLAVVRSSSLSILVVRQLASHPWKPFFREEPPSSCPPGDGGGGGGSPLPLGLLAAASRWDGLLRRFAPDLSDHFRSSHDGGMGGAFPPPAAVVRESWVPSWLARHVPDKRVLARIWDVLMLESSSDDAILYVCIALMSRFRGAILKETSAGKMESVLFDLPSRLECTEDAEAVLSLALHWMGADREAAGRRTPPGSPRRSVRREGATFDGEDDGPPGWTTATVAPVDSAIVEYARHLRKQQRVTAEEEGTAIGGVDEESCISFSQGPDSPFALALKEVPSQARDGKSDTPGQSTRSDGNSTWRWPRILVLAILGLAIAVIFEVECSRWRSRLFVHQEQISSSSVSPSFHRALDGCRKAAVDSSRKLWTQLEWWNHHQNDSNSVVLGPNSSETPEPPSLSSNQERIDSCQEEDEIQTEQGSESGASSTSGNIDDMTAVHSHHGRKEGTREEANEEEREIVEDVSVGTLDDDPRDGVYSGSMNQHDQTNRETFVTLEEDKGSDADQECDEAIDGTSALADADQNAEQIDRPHPRDAIDPLERSRLGAMRLARESLSQTREASKMAESIVSRYFEEATAAVNRVENRGRVGSTGEMSSGNGSNEGSAAPAASEEAQEFFEDGTAANDDEPSERKSRRDAARFTRESLGQAREASKVAESLVSRYLEAAPAGGSLVGSRGGDGPAGKMPGNGDEGPVATTAASEVAQEFVEHGSAPGGDGETGDGRPAARKNEASRQDPEEAAVGTTAFLDGGESSTSRTGDAAPAMFATHFESAEDGIAIDGMAEDRTSVKHPIESHPLSTEHDPSSPEHASRPSENGSGPSPGVMIDDRVEMAGGTVEDDASKFELSSSKLDGADDRGMEFVVAEDSDEIHGSVAAGMVGNGVADIVSSRNGNEEDLWEDTAKDGEDSVGFGDDSPDRHGGAVPTPEQEDFGGAIDESKSDEEDATDDVGTQPGGDSGGEIPRPLFEAAHGLLSRYFGYFGGRDSRPETAIPRTLHLSTPFYGEGELLSVFEQMMASGMDDGTPRKRPQTNVNLDDAIWI